MPIIMDIGIEEDLSGGVINDKQARQRKQEQMKEYRELLAKKGMLK